MNNFLKKPSTDFGAVRDGRASMPLYMDIDLSVARAIGSTGANVPLILNIAGNSLYIDQDTAKVGNATIHFQDTNLSSASAPLFVSAGFIANVPFTQLLVENTAQPGKRLRIFYGVDIDFQAGVNASISISGTVAVSNLPDWCLNPAYVWTSTTNAAANTAEMIIDPAFNTNGVVVYFASFASETGTSASIASIIAHTVAPTTPTDGTVIVPTMDKNGTTNMGMTQMAIMIPAGKGLFFISSAAETSGRNMKHVKAKFL